MGIELRFTYPFPQGFLKESDSYGNIETVLNHGIFTLLHILSSVKISGPSCIHVSAIDMWVVFKAMKCMKSHKDRMQIEKNHEPSS